MLSIKHLIYSSLSTSHLTDLCRFLYSNKVTILMYHGVMKNDDDLDCWWMLKRLQFEKQIYYIYQHFNIISLDDALDALFIKKTKLKNLLVLTFDDGYRNFLDIGFPILKSLGMPCTIYITTGPVKYNSLIWADQLFLAFKNSTKRELDLSDLKLGRWRLDNKITKRLTSHQIIDILKTTPVERKNNMLKEIIERLGEEHLSLPPQHNSFQLLSVDDIKRISQENLITLGSHTVNHEILTNLPIESAAREIVESKEILEQWIGKPVKHFAYPSGNCNDALKNEVKKMGFRSAVIAGISKNKSKDPFQLERIGIGAWDDMSFFRCNVSGLAPSFRRLKQTFKHI